MEEWRDVKGYEGLYMVSDVGNVLSLGHKSNHKNSIVLKQATVMGYKQVRLSKNNAIKMLKVHRLVAEAFIENPYNKKQVNHIDGDKTNNSVKNLEWATARENVKHAFTIGLNTPQRGKDNRRSIKVLQFTKAGEFVGEYFGTREAERFTGIPHGNISKCIKGGVASAGGYIWKRGK